VIDPTTVKQLALEEARRRAETSDWAAAYRSAQPRDPVMVDDLDDVERSYFIVDFRTAEVPTGRMIFRAMTGALGQIAGIAGSQVSLPPFLTRAEVLAVLDGREVPVDGQVKRTITIDAGAVRIREHLGWQPCDQSHSPLQPFYLVDVPGEPDPIYVRIDGTVFPELTTTSAGA
jgi:hypothetical protein